jgi:Peptidase family M23
MIESSDTIESAGVCGLCKSSLLVRRYVHAVGGSSFYILCSKACSRVAARQQSRARWAARLHYSRTTACVIIFAGAYLTPHQGPAKARRQAHRMTSMQQTARSQTGRAALPPGWFGPEWPPTEIGALADLGRDAWIHPLAGPIRRMPRSDSRVFGAVRPGDRAPECRNGHCGVDLGGEIWGEHVHAVHDGVVDWVKRGVNPDRGGQFVRLSHRNGTVFTQYFHLAAIPRGLERGVPVKGGQVIGLLGDSGVKNSAPHLHFTLSVRPSGSPPKQVRSPPKQVPETSRSHSREAPRSRRVPRQVPETSGASASAGEVPETSGAEASAGEAPGEVLPGEGLPGEVPETSNAAKQAAETSGASAWRSRQVSETYAETYVDPEPLIALWPLRVPVEGSEVGVVTTVARPGVPLGSAPLGGSRRRKPAAEE